MLRSRVDRLATVDLGVPRRTPVMHVVRVLDADADGAYVFGGDGARLTCVTASSKQDASVAVFKAQAEEDTRFARSQGLQLHASAGLARAALHDPSALTVSVVVAPLTPLFLYDVTRRCFQWRGDVGDGARATPLGQVVVTHHRLGNTPHGGLHLVASAVYAFPPEHAPPPPLEAAVLWALPPLRVVRAHCCGAGG
jgi:hypothetical protein